MGGRCARKGLNLTALQQWAREANSDQGSVDLHDLGYGTKRQIEDNTAGYVQLTR